MTNSIRENEHDLSDVNDIFDNKDSFSEESVAFDDDVKENESDPPLDNVTSSQILYNNTQQEEELKPALNSKFYAIRITGGQEQVVANILQNKINTKKINILSILVLENFKGYIIVEAPDSNVAFEALHGVRHVRGQIRGELPFKDIEGYLVKKPVVSELNIDDTVEVIAGPFKAMKAKITRVDYEKQEATVVLLDSPYQIPVTVDANYLKKLMQ
ncbi:MAG: transcription elongation factor Spt5 [Thermoproteota archaeon]|nr:transcription elongation factor Spt5 [Thermoproteota archaeon]